MYAVKIVDASATTDDYTLRIEHGPDGTIWETHTAAPALADAGTVRTFQSDATKVLHEFARAVIVTAAATGQYFVVDVDEISRPF